MENVAGSYALSFLYYTLQYLKLIRDSSCCTDGQYALNDNSINKLINI